MNGGFRAGDFTQRRKGQIKSDKLPVTGDKAIGVSNNENKYFSSVAAEHKGKTNSK